ncbi:hypothetical protein SDC9_158986 [bioreactor metagenome]|uniref:Uncharacterized protein n=1 Tax=bioreactor metagenome TaxID=1076179 RepID=A0A645FEA1_9ZZZZ
MDHAQAPTNLGADIMQGHGDESGHPAYHADLTVGYGIEYIWRGRVTSIIGQGTTRSYKSIANWEEPIPSMRTLAKEAVKHVAARLGSRKYAMHKTNRVLQHCSLRDKTTTLEFLRCNPHPHGVSAGDRGDRLEEVLTERFLNRLVETRGVCILYTHLGKIDFGPGLPDLSKQALRRLAEYSNSNRILVTTTCRLLSLLHPNNSGVVEQSVRLPWKQLKFPAL